MATVSVEDQVTPLKPTHMKHVSEQQPSQQRHQSSYLSSVPENDSSYFTSQHQTTVRPSRPRRVLSRFETAPSDGWKLIKKWVGMGPAKGMTKLNQAAGLERQAEINAITPIIMSMFFTQDEDEKKRIPVFLNNMTIKVSKLEEKDEPITKNPKKKKLRGTIFKITVEYGNGPGKIAWSVYRRYWDFVKLHYRYKKSAGSTRVPNFPSLPRHHFRKQKRKDFEERVPMSRLATTASSGLGEMDEDAVMALVNREDESTIQAAPGSTNSMLPESDATSLASSRFMEVVKADKTVLKAMEDYLNQFMTSIEPTGHINRLCKFLEISALGISLAAKSPEYSVHGKEGFIYFQSRTDRDPKQSRKFLQDGLVCSIPTTGGRRRRRPKWFIVRESYVICVDDPSTCEIYDVFLIDQMFDIHRLSRYGDKSSHHISKGRVFFMNLIVNASHWASGKSTLCFRNRQGVYHFRAKNEMQAKQFEQSILTMAQNSVWSKPNRFDSFAPIRQDSSVTWFVDGRDYFWDVSVALENAKDCIYIHDWWLSPELFLRRPAAHNLEWRLDRVLRRKADQGVKVYIVMYKEVAMALPLFSHQAKRHLLSLSENIYVQRHPTRALDIFNKNSIFFWAHHEKICVVDNEVAFIGGLDQCFGRYDTPGHTLVDDLNPDLTNPTNPNPQIWPGKDYSNPRILDFHTLDKPFEDNQDRTILPRMPWHDISMRIVGHGARDVARHFVERWNLLRRKKPSAPKRPTPMLLPVPDNNTRLGIDDPRICHPHTSEKCKIQILRSVSPWSIGSIDEHVEHSIQNAYCDSIRESKYMIYIENQFFVTSTKQGNTVIENNIGNAIVDRILQAHKNGEKWRAIIIVPLVPGFPANVDEVEGSTVRLIMQMQYLSIGRGPDSILGRLHAAGVKNTFEYINFYGLRNWGELNGQFVTEEVYIHAKTMIVDDIRVIMGSANINERSQLGVRDSEIAACVDDDKDLVDSFFNGKPVKVGRYAHSLRMRLMCEHIGVDVDLLDRERYSKLNGIKLKNGSYLDQIVWKDYLNSHKDEVDPIPPFVTITRNEEKKRLEKNKIQEEERNEPSLSELKITNKDDDSDSSDTGSDHSSDEEEDAGGLKSAAKRIFRRHKHHSKEAKEDENHPSQRNKDKSQPGEDTLQPVNTSNSNQSSSLLSPTKSLFNKRKSTKEDYYDFWTALDCDTDNNNDIKDATEKAHTLDCPSYYNSDTVEPITKLKKTVREICRLLQDPLSDDFQNFWHVLARANTDLFRRSFLVTPDNNVRTWDQYHHFIKMAKLFLGRTDVKHGGTKTTAAAANVTSLPLDNGQEGTIADILKHIRGHLVIWPNHFMEEDDAKNEFMFQVDKIAPLEIFD